MAKKRTMGLQLKMDKRDQAFAKALVTLQFKPREAAISVGVNPTSASTWASRALKKQAVQEMVNANVAALLERHDMSADKIVMELKKIGFSNMRDYVRLDDEGNIVLDLSRAMDQESGIMMAAVESIRTDERVLVRGKPGDDGEPTTTILSRRTTLKLYDKTSALDKLLRYVGGYAGKETPNNNTYVFGDVDARQVNVQTMSVNEANKTYQQMLGAPPPRKREEPKPDEPEPGA